MAIEEALRALLLADSDLTALVEERVYPQQTPELGKLPAISYFRVSTPREYTYDAPASETLAHPRFQFDCKANDYPTARETAAALYSALSGYAGTIDDVTIQACFERDSRDEYDQDSKIWMVQKDFEVFHLE